MSHEQQKKVEAAFRDESGRLLGFIRQRVPTTEDAEDILQDVFYQLASSSGYNAVESIDRVSSWLFKVARNKIIDWYRKKKTVPMSEISTGSSDGDEYLMLEDILPSFDRSPESEMMRAVIMERLEDALEEMPQEQRDVFVMHEFEDISFKAMAELTGETINTLLSRKRYAVLYLRKHLQDLYNELNL